MYNWRLTNCSSYLRRACLGIGNNTHCGGNYDWMKLLNNWGYELTPCCGYCNWFISSWSFLRKRPACVAPSVIIKKRAACRELAALWEVGGFLQRSNLAARLYSLPRGACSLGSGYFFMIEITSLFKENHPYIQQSCAIEARYRASYCRWAIWTILPQPTNRSGGHPGMLRCAIPMLFDPGAAGSRYFPRHRPYSRRGSPAGDPARWKSTRQ